MNHQLLSKNKQKPMMKKQRPTLKRMLLKNLLRNVELLLIRQNQLLEKPKEPLNA